MNYPIAIFFGLAPSFIWLLFFLKKDTHPESNQMILKIFFYGMAIALVAAFVELGVMALFQGELTFWQGIFYGFIGIALTEEILKYLVVRRKILRNSAFAALENILILTGLEEGFPYFDTITTSIFRFVGATFLHALASGTLGFFLALSLFYTKKRIRLILTGIFLATLLHGLYNLFIIKTGESFSWIIPPLILLVFLAFFVSFGFKKVKRLKSICKLGNR